MTVAHPQNILIVRTDRIGDVVLSLPMISVLRSCFPHASLSFLLRSYTQDLVAGHEGLNRVLLYDNGGLKKTFGTMLVELRKERFDTVVVTYPTFRLAALMSLARIPVRVGTGYRWYSFLFNRRVYEHRKTAEKHEAEYNFSLLRELGCEAPSRPKPRLNVSEEAKKIALSTRAQLAIGPDQSMVVLHPGSGGSARDWKPENFGELAQRLSQKGFRVVVTGGPGETRLVETVLAASAGKARALPGTLSLSELGAFIGGADVFVSNSTGPLHIAAAVGTPVVSFYPPITQCSSRRWGPLTDAKVIFEPSSADCPRCKGGPCQANECMDLISVEEVAAAVEDLSSKSRKRKAVYA